MSAPINDELGSAIMKVIEPDEDKLKKSGLTIGHFDFLAVTTALPGIVAKHAGDPEKLKAATELNTNLPDAFENFKKDPSQNYLASLVGLLKGFVALG